MFNRVARTNRGVGLIVTLALIALGASASLVWILLRFDLVPREWNSHMRATARLGTMAPSNFVKGGGIAGDDFYVFLGNRNVIQLNASGPDGRPAAPIDLGPASAPRLVVVGAGRILLDGQLGELRPDQVTFILFAPDRIYLYKWSDIRGTYWMRR